VRSGTTAGHGLHDEPKLASSAVLCGLERPWLAEQGELGVAASSPVPETVDLGYFGAARSPTGSAKAGEIACLSAGCSPNVARLEPMRPRQRRAESANRLSFYVRLPSTNPAAAHLRLVLSRSAYSILIWPKINIQEGALTGSRPESHLQSQIHGRGCVTSSSSIWEMAFVCRMSRTQKGFSISGTTSGI
jgi:hypothetical protein